MHQRLPTVRRADGDWLLVDGEIVRDAQVDAEACVLGQEVIDRFVFEEACHA